MDMKAQRSKEAGGLFREKFVRGGLAKGKIWRLLYQKRRATLTSIHITGTVVFGLRKSP